MPPKNNRTVQDGRTRRLKPEPSKAPQLTGALGPAGEGGSRGPCAPVPGPGEEHADTILGVGLQVPDLVGERAHTMGLGPGRLAGPVLDLAADDGAVPHDGVGVELDDQVGGARPQQLGGRDGCGRHCGGRRNIRNKIKGY